MYTLAKAGASDDVEITKQIPEDLRKSKTLILAPPGLIDNWWEEFQKWLPMKNEKELKQEYIGRIYRADSIMSASARMKSLQQWNKDGGILLIGYAMFRTFVFPATKAIQDNEALREAKKTLLEGWSTIHSRSENPNIDDRYFSCLGPNVIVADEAHSIKNPRAKISMAASMFRSRSRIAMTGSPLSNNLNEYWSMIEWIDPGYLGPEVEFRRKYVEPITDGIYADSSKEERRVSLTKLRALNEDIKIKIHRADINAILSDILPKTEFLITVPLTKLQSDMYHRYIPCFSVESIAE